MCTCDVVNMYGTLPYRMPIHTSKMLPTERRIHGRYMSLLWPSLWVITYAVPITRPPKPTHAKLYAAHSHHGSVPCSSWYRSTVPKAAVMEMRASSAVAA